MHPQFEALADRIADAQAQGARFVPMAEVRDAPATAYAVQDRLLVRWRAQLGPVGGWKVGLTTPRMQALCGVSQPIVGAIFASRIHASPARVRADDFVRLGLEFEMSFRVASCPPQGGDHDAGSVRRHLDAASASFELIDDRDADYACLDGCSMAADNSWNRGLVLAAPRPLDDLSSVRGLDCVLECGGEVVDRGCTDDVGGDPLAIVAWLANHLHDRGRRLEPGQWIMTGSMVPTRFACAGEAYSFHLAGFESALVGVV